MEIYLLVSRICKNQYLSNIIIIIMISIIVDSIIIYSKFF